MCMFYFFFLSISLFIFLPSFSLMNTLVVFFLLAHFFVDVLMLCVWLFKLMCNAALNITHNYSFLLNALIRMRYIIIYVWVCVSFIPPLSVLFLMLWFLCFSFFFLSDRHGVFNSLAGIFVNNCCSYYSWVPDCYWM